MATSRQEYWQRIIDNQTLVYFINLLGKQLSIDESTGPM
jgi:hypothetical protein